MSDPSLIPPASMDSPIVGLREVTLLTIAAAYALLMFNLGGLAIIAGWLAVALWLFALIHGPRASGALSAVYGAAVVLMTFWWPDNSWAPVAVSLMWIGATMVVAGMAQHLLKRSSTPTSGG